MPFITPPYRVMANIILPPDWQGHERDATDQSAYENRRTFIKKLGLGAAGIAAGRGQKASHVAAVVLTVGIHLHGVAEAKVVGLM